MTVVTRRRACNKLVVWIRTPYIKDSNKNIPFHVQNQDHHFLSQITSYVACIVTTRPCPHHIKARSSTKDRLNTFQQERMIINKCYGNHSQPSLSPVLY